jgi:KaiC/GvpD/RAD55 family RecA-like ATPase
MQVEAALEHKIPSALTVAARPLPELVATGIAELDAAIGGGIPRGAVTEICGSTSSGRTSVLLSLLARVTQREESVAIVDASDAFHPESAEIAGVDLKRVLWVRCQKSAVSHQLPENSSAWRVVSGEKKQTLARVEQVLKATDLLLQSGGFGLIVVDLGNIRGESARRVPLTTWFRFRRAIENTPTAMVILEQEPYAKTCASLVMELRAVRQEFVDSLSAVGCRPWANFEPQRTQGHAMENAVSLDSAFRAPLGMTSSRCANTTSPTHSHLLHGMRVEVEISRGQLMQKKPPASVPAFETSTALLSSVP